MRLVWIFTLLIGLWAFAPGAAFARTWTQWWEGSPPVSQGPARPTPPTAIPLTTEQAKAAPVEDARKLQQNYSAQMAALEAGYAPYEQAHADRLRELNDRLARYEQGQEWKQRADMERIQEQGLTAPENASTGPSTGARYYITPDQKSQPVKVYSRY